MDEGVQGTGSAQETGSAQGAGDRILEPEDPLLDGWYTANAERQDDPDLDVQYAFLVRRLDQLSRGTVLDLGCNCSPFAFALAARYPHLSIIGLDRDAAAIRLAERTKERRMLANLSFRRADATDLRADERLAAITCIQTLHHLDLGPALRSVHAALGEGGVFYFRDFNREEAGRLPEMITLADEERGIADGIRRLRSKGDDAFLSTVRSLDVKGAEGEAGRELAILRACSFLAAYTPAELERALREAGFTEVFVRRRGQEIEGIAQKQGRAEP